MDELLLNLTPAQQEAVMHRDGPMLILAAPGSGKTRVITHRVAWLIRQGIPPRNILAITFTNKAAKEMRERLTALRVPRGSTIGTFHSVAARLLREFHERANLSADFSIYDTADQKAALREALKRCELDSKQFTPGRLLSRISSYKTNIQLPDDLEPEKYDYLGKIAKRVYSAYQEVLQANAALDFDDLLMRLALLLRDDRELRSHLNNRFRYLMIDEYQDTNHSQYLIARGLSLEHENIVATGDPDQSIYGWRGADIGNILAFEQDFPNAKIVRLEENFRSTPQVLALADHLIRQNKQRKEKQLFTRKPDGTDCELFAYPNEYEEAEGMVQWIRSLRKEGLEYRDMAVFYRVNSMSRVLEESLRKSRIPYQIVRGVEFFQRKEIKDILAYLRLLVNPSDQVALRRIINTPARGIGKTTLERLFTYCEESGQDIRQVLENAGQVPTLKAAALSRVKKFVLLINHLRAQQGENISELIQNTYKLSGLEALHKAEGNDDAMDNVNELINSAMLYQSEAEEVSLADYLQEIALISDTDSFDENAGAVSLMTLHAAKGLEFPAVLIIGIEEGLLPHARSVNTDAEIEEERRLLFVGMTRAQQKLTLSFAQNRTMQGMSNPTILSQFLRNLPNLQYHKAGHHNDCRSFTIEDEDDFPDDDYNPAEDDQQDSEAIGFNCGQLVRHPKLGLGRIKQVMPRRDNSRVVVQFQNGSRKTLVLKYAHLERVDFMDY